MFWKDHLTSQKKRQKIQELLVDNFLAIYRNQEAIEFEIGPKIDARCYAGDVLYYLDCEDSPDQFFAVARSLDWYKSYSEIHDSGSNDFKLLERFVADTIAVKGQIYSNGFENDPREK